MQPTYNTTRWVKMAIIGRDGSLFADNLIDTLIPSQASFMVEQLERAAGRVHTRPASVAVLAEAGEYQVNRVDAIYCPLVPATTGRDWLYTAGDCDVLVTAGQTGTPGDPFFGGQEVTTGATMSVVR